MKVPTRRVDIDLLIPPASECAPFQQAIEEIDRAAALLGPELDARDTVLRVRVLPQQVRPGPEGHGPCSLGLTVDGDAVHSDATCTAPPAALVVGIVHRHLDAAGLPAG